MLTLSYLVREYPGAMYHRQTRFTQPDTELPVLGPNTNSAEKHICIDYRRLNLTASIAQLERDNNLPRSTTKQRRRADFKVGVRGQDIVTVKKFVFFIGYPRSGHSIVGSIMDAHPNTIIAHEYNLFRQFDRKPSKHLGRMFLYNALFENSVNSVLSGWRSDQQNQKGYTLDIEQQWQANFSELLVIGDKSGAVTTQFFHKDPARFMEILATLQHQVRVPIRVLHVIRNPYDMIATRVLYTDLGTDFKSSPTEEKKHCNHIGLGYHTNRVFEMVKAVQSFKERTNLTVLDLHLADLVSHPMDTISTICQFLDLPCPASYLDACERKVFKRLSKTRLLVDWPQEMVEEVKERAKPYGFLWRYSFDGD